VPATLRPEVFHQAGKHHAKITAERYREAGVGSGRALHQRHGPSLWLGRPGGVPAGALTVSELAAAGLPSMLVPLPHAIDDHQTRNAEYLAREGAAFLMPQATTGAADSARLNEVLMQPERLNVMAGRPPPGQT
jgi:UDP-N-acetylglucosamine--N-acetylmuramyl-(pentapeptide) pyrophosphoryl-undecaprenol N-acetylglucosamine transferase